MPFTNELTDAQAERLAILLEEMGEAQQAIGKILRHGYLSFNPNDPDQVTNQAMLERELGDVSYAVSMLIEAGDVSSHKLRSWHAEKERTIGPYLHYQSE